LDQCGYALRMFRVGEAFEQAVGGAKNGKSDLGAVNIGSEALVVALAGLAEENCFDWAGGTERFFDEADTFDADGAGFRGQTAAKSGAELFQPPVVAAGQDSRCRRGSCWCVAGGFAWRGHPRGA
jgi:hypothetical protein